jgi:hypothetical protein
MRSSELLSRELLLLRHILVLINTDRYEEARICLQTEVQVVNLLLQTEQ